MSFFNELKRRNVFKVGAAYAVTAWMLLQLTDVLGDMFGLPTWGPKFILLILMIGFIIALFFAWAFELTPDGIKREAEIDRSLSIAGTTGKKLNHMIMVILVLALAFFTYDKFILDPDRLIAEIATAVQLDRDKTSKKLIEETTLGDQSTLNEHSIAVLPFVNMSSDQEQEYFSDGLAEELLNLLAKIPELQVAARTSSFSFKNQSIEIPVIAARLKVAHILEGSVRKSGQQVRITAQLIKADSGYHLWSETYDRSLDNIFAVQDEIASAVVAALKLTLLGKNLPVVRETSPEAYTLFLQGRYLFNQAAEADFAKSASAFQQAIELDPNYAPAWVGLSRAILKQAGYGMSDLESGLKQAREAIEHAIRLDPGLAGAWSQLGYIQGPYDWDWATAGVSLQQALELAPNSPDVLLAAAIHALVLGQLDQSISFIRQALEFDPLNQSALSELIGALSWIDTEEALQVAHSLNTINPDYFLMHTGLAQLLLQQGLFEQALDEAEKEPSEFWRWHTRSIVLFSAGRELETEAILAKLEEKYAQSGAYQIAESYAWQNKTDTAFKWLDRAIKQHDPGISYVLLDHSLRKLHNDPRWLELLSRIKLLDAWNAMPDKYKDRVQ